MKNALVLDVLYFGLTAAAVTVPLLIMYIKQQMKPVRVKFRRR